MGWRQRTSWWRSRAKVRGDAHNDEHEGAYHVNVDLIFRDASAAEQHEEKDRAEFAERQRLLEERQAMFEARVAALEMGSRDNA